MTDYDMCETKQIASVQAESPSPLDNLRRRKLQYEERLKAVNDAIEALEANPQVTKVLELLAKAR